MLRKPLFLALAAALAALLTSSRAHAWGFHAGYTHVGPRGVYHVGRTAYGGYGGAYRSGGAYRYGGAYGYGAHYGGAYRYGGYRYAPSYYGGYRTGGVYGYRYGARYIP